MKSKLTQQTLFLISSILLLITQAFAYDAPKNKRYTPQGTPSHLCIPFPGCKDAQFLVAGEPDQVFAGTYIVPRPSKLYQINAATGATQQVGDGDMGIHIDAMAFSPSNNFLFGINDTTTATRDVAQNRIAFRQSARLNRLDVQGVAVRVGTIAPPVAYAQQPSFVLPYAADIDVNGNYYFLAIAVRQGTVTATNYRLQDYDLYIGRIDDGILANTLEQTLPIEPIYTKVNIGSCAGVLDSYLERYINAVLDNNVRPTDGIQDFTINPLTNTIQTFLATERLFLSMGLPDIKTSTPAPITAFCTPATGASFAALPTTASFGGLLYNNTGDFYGYDAANGVYYGFNGCAAGACSSVSAITTFNFDFSDLHPGFKNLVGDAAACTLREIPCTTTAFSVLATRPTVPGDDYGTSQLFATAPLIGSISFSKIADITYGGQPLFVDGLAYNPFDNFLYALNDENNTGTPTVYKIDGNGNAVQAAVMQAPPVPTSYQNSVILPTPISSSLPISTRKSLIFTEIGAGTEDARYYNLAMTYRLSKTNTVSTVYDRLEYNLSISKYNLNTPTVAPVYIALQNNQPTFSCQSTLDNFAVQAIQRVASGSNLVGLPIQDWAMNPTDSKLWTYLGGDDIALSIELPTIPGNFAIPQCYATTPDQSTNVFDGIFFTQSGAMYGIDGASGKAYSIDISGCPAAACSKLSTPSALPAVGGSTNLISDAASCTFRTALPVNLIRFAGAANGCGVKLQWVTAEERNSQSFIVERSDNGSQFSEIGVLSASGNSNTIITYDYTDKEVNKNVYYRLKQIDFDGTVNYPSEIISVQSRCNKVLEQGVTLFPNPTSRIATLNYIAAEQQGAAQLIVTDITGRLIAQENTPLITEGTNLISIDTEGWANGMYFVSLRGADGWVSETKRLVKSK